MKSYFLILSILLISLTSFSKDNQNTELINSFFKSKTYIVYDQSLFCSYNFHIKDIVKDNWTITEYELIHYEEFEKIRKDKNNSFLVLSNVQFTKDKTKTTYNFLNLVMGQNTRTITDMPDLVNIPLSIAEQDEEIWIYKLTTLVLFVQKHMMLLKENTELLSVDIAEVYKTPRSMHGKTLYLLKEDLEGKINSNEKISHSYKNEVEIVTIQKLTTAIENKSPGIVFLHKVGSNSPRGNKICFKILIDAEDASIYYLNTHFISKQKPNLFLKGDFENINN